MEPEACSGKSGLRRHRRGRGLNVHRATDVPEEDVVEALVCFREVHDNATKEVR